jgi:hypothetical protein
VALVRSATALTCKTAADSSADSSVVDLLGYRGGAELLGENQTSSGRLEIIAPDGSPAVDVGDTYAGATIGPIDYSDFGGYTLVASTLGTVQKGNLAPVVATPGKRGQLSVATYNVENLAPSDPDAKFTRLADSVVTNLASPDVMAVEEVQDNTGATDDGTVDASTTLQQLTAAIVKAGGPHYGWREIDPVDDQDGGEPGGNIRVCSSTTRRGPPSSTAAPRASTGPRRARRW